MSDFLASLGPFGWAVIALGLFGLVTLPRGLREMWKRPWKKDWKDGHFLPRIRDDRDEGPGP